MCVEYWVQRGCTEARACAQNVDQECRKFQHLTYDERLKKLDLYSVQGRLLRADIIQYWKIFHGQSRIKPEDLFTQPLHSNTRGHRFKIHVPRVSLDVRKRSFSYRCVAIWNGLPDEVVASADLNSFKMALANTIHSKLYEYSE